MLSISLLNYFISKRCFPSGKIAFNFDYFFHLLLICIIQSKCREKQDELTYNVVSSLCFQPEQPLQWMQYLLLLSNAADYQDWRGWYRDNKWGREKGDGGGGGPERHRYRKLARGRGLGRATAREWRRPGLSSAHKRAPRRRQTTRRHQETGPNRSGWRGSTAEEDRNPGSQKLDARPPQDRQVPGCR